MGSRLGQSKRRFLFWTSRRSGVKLFFVHIILVLTTLFWFLSISISQPTKSCQAETSRMEQQAWKKELDQQAKAKAQAKGKAKPKAKAKAKSQSKANAKKEKGPKEAKAKARGRPRKNGTKVEKTPEKSQEAGMSASPEAKVEKKAKAEKNVKGKETKPKETAVNKRKHDGDKTTFAGRYKSSTKTTGMIWECLRNKFESSLKSKLRSPSKLEARKFRMSKKFLS